MSGKLTLYGEKLENSGTLLLTPMQRKKFKKVLKATNFKTATFLRAVVMQAVEKIEKHQKKAKTHG